MIIGAHSIIYSKRADADRAFLRDVLKLHGVDVGDGWLIFGLPPAEVAIHPSDTNDVHEFYLMCEDVKTLVVTMRERGTACTTIQNQGWGLMTHVTLPGGGKLGIYQPMHPRPEPRSTKKTTRKLATRTVKSAARKKKGTAKSSTRGKR